VMKKPRRKAKMRASKLRVGTTMRTSLFLDPRPVAANSVAKKTMAKGAPSIMRSFKMTWRT